MSRRTFSHHPPSALTRWGTLALILLLAAGLRLTRLGLVEFKYDEATTARSALRIAREGYFPAMGMISSQGPHNPPLMSYVLALPFALSRDPRLAAGWVALLGVAAVGLTYWLGQAYFGWPVGVLAAVLFAASPWAVFHSRKIWAQNLPVLTLTFVAAVLALVVRRRPWALVGALAAAGGLVSLHLGGLAFLFVLVSIAVFFHRQIRSFPLLVGLAAFLLILSPYLVHDARHGWSNLRGLYTSSREKSGGSALNLEAFRTAALAATGERMEALAGSQHDEFVASIVDARWLDQVEMALFWAGLAWLIWRTGREVVDRRGEISAGGRARLVLLCWFVVPVVLLMLRGTTVHPHDLNVIYPVQHVIIALFLVGVMEKLARDSSRLFRFALYGLVLFLVMLVAWQVYFQEALLTFVDAHETPGGHGPPLKYTLAASRRAEALLKGSENTELILLLPGADPHYDGWAAAFDVLLPRGGSFRAEWRLVDGRKMLVLPNRSTVYLADSRTAAASTLAKMANEVVPGLPVRGGSDAAYRFFHRDPSKVNLAHARRSEPKRWLLQQEAGRGFSATLLGYSWSGEVRPGETIRWTLVWRIEGRPSTESDVHWFNHLMDEKGVRLGQKDAAAFPVFDPGEASFGLQSGHAGDTGLSWFDIAIDPDASPPPYFVRSGMYLYPQIVNVPLVDAAGNPAGDFVALGPVPDATP